MYILSLLKCGESFKDAEKTAREMVPSCCIKLLEQYIYGDLSEIELTILM